MTKVINIQKEVYTSLKALERVKNISKISAISVKALDKDSLNIEDFEEIFKIIIEECEVIETAVSNLETLDNE
jgi:hypothetical protein